MSEEKRENSKEELNVFEKSEEIHFFTNQTNSSLVILKTLLIENILGFQFYHLHFKESMFLLVFENKKKDGFGVLKKKHKETILEEFEAIKAKESGPRPTIDGRSTLLSLIGFKSKIVLRVRPTNDGRSRPTVIGRSREAEDISKF
ncbi:hypothetical protein M9H77_12657 [Catharanthus roseus]|uniref:Uncharacterized protein n=1 Tax=Catharanthus roseus TaxID=4058 RepID=A0ACC0BI92_CATRO|nr:hypothetical protein M9H77_12657 [Catharanthus roseus]